MTDPNHEVLQKQPKKPMTRRKMLFTSAVAAAAALWGRDALNIGEISQSPIRVADFEDFATQFGRLPIKMIINALAKETYHPQTIGDYRDEVIAGLKYYPEKSRYNILHPQPSSLKNITEYNGPVRINASSHLGIETQNKIASLTKDPLNLAELNISHCISHGQVKPQSELWKRLQQTNTIDSSNNENDPVLWFYYKQMNYLYNDQSALFNLEIIDNIGFIAKSRMDNSSTQWNPSPNIRVTTLFVLKGLSGDVQKHDHIGTLFNPTLDAIYPSQTRAFSSLRQRFVYGGVILPDHFWKVARKSIHKTIQDRPDDSFPVA